MYDNFYEKYGADGGEYGILGQGSDHTVFAFYVGIAALDTGFGGDTAWGAYHSLYDTLRWQEIVDPDWMLAEDIARFTGILTLKLLDEIVLPFDVEIFASTMKEWFTERLMNAMIDYNCDPNDFVLDANVTLNLLDAIEEFEDVAIELNEIVMEVANRTSAGVEGREDKELVSNINSLLSSVSKMF